MDFPGNPGIGKFIALKLYGIPGEKPYIYFTYLYIILTELVSFHASLDNIILVKSTNIT